jgi:hypothetical protein
MSIEIFTTIIPSLFKLSLHMLADGIIGESFLSGQSLALTLPECMNRRKQ